MASGLFAALTAPPLSPWAERNKPKETVEFPQYPGSHSGLAPLQPPLNPKYYVDVAEDNSTETGPAEPHILDTLFYTEDWQQTRFRGLQVWEAGSLNLLVGHSAGLEISGGHQLCDKPSSASSTQPSLEQWRATQIQVDENSWLPFLRKDRWLDLVNPEPLLGGGRWSVDNPKVWRHVSVAVELANRILNSLLDDRHTMLETVMFGLWTRYRTFPDLDQCQGPHIGKSRIPSNWSVLLSYPYYKALCDRNDRTCRLDFIKDLTKDQWKERLLAMTEKQTWGFSDALDAWAEQYEAYNGMIALNISPIKNLIDPDITVAEHSLLQMNLAVTIVHELFHALMDYRSKGDGSWNEDVARINRMSKSEGIEPYVDFDDLNELGYAMEHRVFGGRLDIGDDANSFPVGPHLMSRHLPYYIEVGRGQDFEQSSIRTTYRIPALHASKMLSREFWEDQTTTRKSDNFFGFNQIFSNASQLVNETPTRSHRAYNRVRIDRRLPAHLHPGEQRLIEHWNSRHQLWQSMRHGWYDTKRSEWEASPWRYRLQREKIKEFNDHFRRKRESRCLRIADYMINLVDWKNGRQSFLDALPPAAEENETHFWVFHAIGLLMRAALPLRTDAVKDAMRSKTARVTLVPSSTAKALSKVDMLLESDEERSWKPTDVFPDPLGKGIEGHQDPEQSDYIDSVGTLITHLGRQGVQVSDTWVGLITSLAESLRAQRQDLKANNPAAHKSMWAKWDIEVPVYNRTLAAWNDYKWGQVTNI
ncbi:hypothetical protein GGR57DRAFT_451168 [Xylariaceae sp. FL1272]|nr:hypothetical protein GGR57DRAFT_451168 [Xylariaceae sp. FL1272]